jgi:hypothetical protein
MKFDVRSYEGVGPIRFGMSPVEVRENLGMEFENFRRNASDVHPTDYFKRLQCFVYYGDSDGLVEAVEFAEPAAPTFNGLNMLGLPYEDLIVRMHEFDRDIAMEIDGFSSFRLGIGGWAPHCKEEPELPCDSIIVFARGYYD